MRKIQYEKFDLTIEPRRADGSYRVKVDTVLGQDSDYMCLPQSIADLRDLMEEAVKEVRGLSRVERDLDAAAQTPTKELGSMLFDSLFHGRVSNMYWKCLGRIETKQNLGLRITLHMDPEDPSLAELASLPWELLFMKARRSFLSQSTSTPIIRFLDVPRPVIPLPLQLPLRVLVCMSSPVDQKQLNLEKERNLVERHLGDRQDIQIKFLPHTMPEQLLDELSSNPPHVLHFMGHGGFIEDSGRGVLLLEDLFGESRPLSGEDLGMLLENKPTRLVFLNACDTARAATQEGQDPFSGVATALVMKGVPAVVAMQFPISDRAAIAFTRRVYKLLAQGFPIDAAVAEGRQMIILNESGSMEWVTPVLFMRTADGVLFVPQKTPEPPKQEPPERVRPPPVPVSGLYWSGVARSRQRRWREAMECFQRVVAVDPDYRDVQERLAEAQGHVEREETLAGLYAMARDLTQASDWLAVVTLFDEIHGLEPGYPDPEGLLGAAYHGQALELMDAEKWSEAVEGLEQVCALLPEHSDAPALLEYAKREQAEAQRQRQAAGLYAEAVRLLHDDQWQPALDKLTEARGRVLDYPDPQQIAEKARRELKAAQVRQQADALYAEAVRLLQAEEWQTALEKLVETRGLSPDHPDPQQVASTARQQLQALEQADREAAQWRRWADEPYSDAVRSLEAERTVERRSRAGDELQRIWRMWLAAAAAHSDHPAESTGQALATVPQLRYLAKWGTHLQPKPVQALLLLHSAVVHRELAMQPWLDWIQTPEGETLIRDLEEPGPVQAEGSARRSAHDQAMRLLRLSDLPQEDEPLAEAKRFGKVTRAALEHRDPRTRHTATLALTAVQPHPDEALGRLRAALAGARGTRFRRKTQAWATLIDADPLVQEKSGELSWTERVGVWWWRAWRRIVHHRRRIGRLTAGGGLGAGIALGLLRAIIAIPTSLPPVAIFGIFLFYGGILGAALSLGVLLSGYLQPGKMEARAGTAEQADGERPRWSWSTLGLCVLLGTLFFGLAHFFVAFVNGMRLLKASYILPMGLLAAVGLSASLYAQPEPRRRQRWWLWPLRLAASAATGILALLSFNAVGVEWDRALAIGSAGGFYKANLGWLVEDLWPRLVERFDLWQNILAMVDAGLMNIVLTLGITAGLNVAANWLSGLSESKNDAGGA